MKSKLLFLLPIIPLSTHAQITTDGSLGPPQNLPGPDYQIGADLGQQRGGNLFHSFQDFNLQSWESATFSGPNSVQNVISRVTGGNPSNIDGLFRSTIPGADVYFLNPYGIMFGPNARLDVQGSFHASTADYLRLGDGGRFDAHQPNNSILTVAPIEAFGFLDYSVAPISAKGLKPENTELEIPENKILSLIGGHIEIENDTILDTRQKGWERKPDLLAPSGRIDLVSVASPGEVIPTDSGITLNSFEKLGIISLSKVTLKTNGKKGQDSHDLGGSSIFLRGEQILLQQGTTLEAETVGSFDGGIIDLRANLIFLSQSSLSGTTWEGGGDASQIVVQADDLVMERDSRISSDSMGEGSVEQISIEAKQDIKIADSVIASIAYDKGDSAKIVIKTTNLFLEAGYISGETRHFGNAGDIHIHATDMIMASGAGSIISGDIRSGQASVITSVSANESDIGGKSGQGGNIFIEANQLIIKDGGQISTGSIAPQGRSSGPGGSITIHVAGEVELSGVNPYGENQNGFGSGIYASSRGVENNASKGGTIELHAGTLQIKEGAVIESGTNNNAQGGDINIYVNGTIQISGDASKIALRTPARSQLEYQSTFPLDSSNQSTSGIYASSTSPMAEAGQSGNINIVAQNLILTENGTISTSSAGGGTAGDITVTVEQLQLDNQAIIASESQIANTYQLDSLAELEQFLSTGDIVEIADTGEGKIGTRQNIGNRLVAVAPLVEFVPDEKALEQLSNKYDYLPKGWVVKVMDVGGKPAYFRYNVEYIYDHQLETHDVKSESWTQIDELPNTQRQIGTIHRVANLDEMNQFKFAEVGVIAQVNHGQSDQSSRFIYSGTQWLPLNIDKPRTVQSLSELNQLSAQAGDQAEVLTANDQYEHYFYADGEWKKQFKGGDAGTITITARDGIYLSNDSQMSTKAESASGGSITLEIGGRLHIDNSEISSSVQEGMGNGGDLTIKGPQFVIIDNGKIIAKAYEGQGGNIHIGSKQFIASPKSEVSASSKLGIDGNVDIEAPEMNLDAFLVTLPGGYVLESKPSEPCRIKSLDELSTFKKEMQQPGGLKMPEWFQE
jgi:filamentous hemagglutinin family protein